MKRERTAATRRATRDGAPKSNNASKALTMHRQYDIVVIGGGAAGMMAAIAAMEERESKLPSQGGAVLLLERNDILGRKLLATGNGRCNFTNAQAQAEDYENKNDANDLVATSVENPSSTAAFVRPVMDELGPERLIELFSSLGILARQETEGRVYPHSGQGASVCQMLQRRLGQLGVEICLQATVKEITVTPEGVASTFHILLEGGCRVDCRRVIVAVGGKAGGQYGCQGDGFRFAEQLGHRIVKPRPALVAVNCRALARQLDDLWGEWKGVRARGTVSLWRAPVDLQTGSADWSKASMVSSDSGEVQFTESGLSGICVFNVSRDIVYTGNMKDGRREAYRLAVDFLPELSESQVGEMLHQRRQALATQTAESLLLSVIHSRLICGILRQAGISQGTMVSEVKDDALTRLASLLKSWTTDVEGTKGWNDAQVTAGGVALEQVDAQTMESLVTPGLYLCGELLDVDGRCGGYNLQWAFASGYVAGKRAGRASNI